jgi:pyridoxine kinase
MAASRASRPRLDGLAARGGFARCDGVLSGYAPSGEAALVMAEAAPRVRAANPRSLYCCDPVLGDDGRLYVPPETAVALRDRALPEADLATPNAFELAWLTGGQISSLKDTRAAAASLARRMRPDGRRTVLVTSLRTDATPDAAVDILAVEPEAAFLLRTPELHVRANGAGDVLAGLFLFHLLATGSTRQALERAVASVFGLLRRTAAANARELLLIEAQQEFVSPTAHFSATLL